MVSGMEERAVAITEEWHRYVFEQVALTGRNTKC